MSVGQLLEVLLLYSFFLVCSFMVFPGYLGAVHKLCDRFFAPLSLVDNEIAT